MGDDPETTSRRGSKRSNRSRVAGTQGYEIDTERQIASMESADIKSLWSRVEGALPAPPTDVLDVGAGSGRDASYLAGLGHRVVAVEPFAAFRRAGETLHGADGIQWIGDSLPALENVTGVFDFVLVQAVWMHLEKRERPPAMRRLRDLLRPAGTLLLSLRHGPVPGGKRMFEVTKSETLQLAAALELRPVLVLDNQPSALPGKDAVTWTRIVLRNDE